MRNKVVRLPIGLGMNHLEQEYAASWVWNQLIDDDLPPGTWLEINQGTPHIFATNYETGKSLENTGCIEMTADRQFFRLTEKAIDLLEKFTAEQ
jgi:hypothetical protein